MPAEQPTSAPLLRDYIDIPERTSTGDFVLKLADSVADADATLRDHLITERLPQEIVASVDSR